MLLFQLSYPLLQSPPIASNLQSPSLRSRETGSDDGFAPLAPDSSSAAHLRLTHLRLAAQSLTRRLCFDDPGDPDPLQGLHLSDRARVLLQSVSGLTRDSADSANSGPACLRGLPPGSLLSLEDTRVHAQAFLGTSQAAQQIRAAYGEFLFWFCVCASFSNLLVSVCCLSAIFLPGRALGGPVFCGLHEYLQER